MKQLVPPSLFGLSGFYQFETGRIVGTDEHGNDIEADRTVVVPWFQNVITDAGLDLLGTSSADNLTFCRIGTNTAAAAFSDTTLGTQVGSTSTQGTGGVTGNSGDNTYLYRRVSRRFTAGTISGQALAEVGMGATASGVIFSRSLIKESGGSPITFTLPPDQFLDVIYELRCYIGAADIVTTETIDGVETTVTSRRHGALTEGQWINFSSVLGSGLWFTFNANNRRTFYCLETQPAVATTPGWRGGDFIDPTRAYVPGSRQVTLEADIPLGQYNFTSGLGAIVVAVGDIGATALNGAWSWGFSPKLNKTATRIAEIKVGLSWGRH